LNACVVREVGNHVGVKPSCFAPSYRRNGSVCVLPHPRMHDSVNRQIRPIMANALIVLPLELDTGKANTGIGITAEVQVRKGV
jgi:hypothetical protein